MAEVIFPSLPLDVPAVPGFNREPFEHTIKALAENVAYDDLCTSAAFGESVPAIRWLIHVIRQTKHPVRNPMGWL